MHWYDPSNLQFVVSITAAVLSSVIACACSQPGDMILTETYRTQQNSSILNVFQQIYDRHGFRGFFFGFEARLAHIVSIITVQLVLYDLIKTSLGLPVTGLQ